MSTKTSLLKRIAQTAVVALFGGLMTVVAAPASNAAASTAISGSCVAREAIGGVISVSFDDTGDSQTVIRAVQTSRTVSAGNAYTLQTDVASTGTDTSTVTFAIPLAAETLTATTGNLGGATITYLVWADLDGPASSAGNLAPAAGDYTTSVTCTIAGAPTSFSLSATTASVGSGETSTFTVTPKDAAGVATLLNGSTDSFTVTATTGSSDSTVVNLVSGVPTNSAKTSFRVGGNYGGADGTAGVSRSQLGDTTAAVNHRSLNVSFTGPSTASNRAQISASASMADTAVTHRASSNGSPNGVIGLATAESMTATGAFSFNVSTVGAGTTTVTVAGAGLLSGMTSATFTQTTTSQAYGSGYGFGSNATTTAAGFGIKKFASSTYSDPGVSPDKTGTYASPSNSNGLYTPNNADATFYVSTAKTSIPITIQMSAAGSLPYTVAATSTTSVTPAGITTGSFNATTTTETQTTITFTTTAPSAGQRFKVTWKADATTTRTVNFVYEAPQVASGIGTVTLSDSGKVAVGGTSTVTATVTDQYGSPAAGATVIFSRTGRNATLANESVVANADGIASHTWTDASTSTTSLTDTVSVRAALGVAGTYTTAQTAAFTYVTALTATTVTLINNGAAAGSAVDTAVRFTATVLDASGLALSGYPVVFTGDDETYYNTTSNAVTKYTNTAGVATADFYGYKSGTATVTAASGGKSATSNATIIAGSSRAISIDLATASVAVGASTRVTATVKDIYGNAVEAASVGVKYVGTSGRVLSVNGVSSATGSTDAAGQVVVEVSGDSAGTGTLTLTITAGNTSTLALTSKGTARPAKVETVTTAVTITGTSASVSAANAATAAAEAASDAAAEAIDAANAATDAANLAAEAADAATVAAEEARDAADAATAAVEELATQVATLMAALKAQITTLANTVAKIAKKVKA